MKKKNVILAFALCVVLSGCGETIEISSKGESMNVAADPSSDVTANTSNDAQSGGSSASEDTASSGDTASSDTTAITREMAYEGVNNYCHQEYDWTIAEENPDIMYVCMGDGTDTEYLVIFRSYTGSFVYFYVNKSTGLTRMVEVVPSMDIEEEAGTINIYDYI